MKMTRDRFKHDLKVFGVMTLGIVAALVILDKIFY